jgi:hypothetical protein
MHTFANQKEWYCTTIRQKKKWRVPSIISMTSKSNRAVCSGQCITFKYVSRGFVSFFNFYAAWQLPCYLIVAMLFDGCYHIWQLLPFLTVAMRMLSNIFNTSDSSRAFNSEQSKNLMWVEDANASLVPEKKINAMKKLKQWPAFSTPDTPSPFCSSYILHWFIMSSHEHQVKKKPRFFGIRKDECQSCIPCYHRFMMIGTRKGMHPSLLKSFYWGRGSMDNS